MRKFNILDENDFLEKHLKYKGYFFYHLPENFSYEKLNKLAQEKGLFFLTPEEGKKMFDEVCKTCGRKFRN